jgi:hypothetical protein
MPTPNFQLVTEIQTLTRRDFYLADETLLQPFNANPVIDGEWLVLNSDYKLARGSGEGTDPNVFPLFTERGRYDTQAIGKASTLFLGMYEAQTKVIDTTGLVLGSALTVQDVTYQSLTRRGLKLDAAGAGRVRVGFVSKLSDGGYVRFIHFGNQKM